MDTIRRDIKHIILHTHGTFEHGTSYHFCYLNEGVKYFFWQCDQQFTQKESLAEHQRAVHKGFKYPCGQWGKELSFKGCLAKRQKSVHRSQ